MSFSGYKTIIEENDTVILYLGFNTMYPLLVTPTKTTRKGEEVENVFQTNYGAFKVKDLIGKMFGTKVAMTKGYGYALYPTPELWTKTLPHRTQIIYATDISLILTQLELGPGSIVIESGTGSGSLSHSFIRTIAPNGHLHTFDFHKERVQLANEEFKAHGVDHLVTCRLADACTDGFGLTDVADAVFLDLPRPWEAVPHAKKSLKQRSGGRICSFSPCIEQVMKTAAKLKEVGFTEISTVECLLREMQVRKINQTVFDPSRQPTTKVENRDTAVDPVDADDIDDTDGAVDDGNDDEAGSTKKRKFDDEAPTAKVGENLPTPKVDETQKSFVTAIPLLKMPGHTGFLTFATLPPCH